MHRFLLHNELLHDTAEKLISPGQVGYMNGWGCFSTLRICKGILFAFERHYARMRHDSERMNVPFPYSSQALSTQLAKLVEANQAWNATLRVALVRNRGGIFEGAQIERDCDLVAFTAPLNQWGEGVKLTYVPHARYGASPYSGAKVTSWVENLVFNENARRKGFDEALLLNEHGQISECTSANVFGIFGSKVLTPPLATSGCLPGITRALLLEEVKIPGITVEEAVLTPADMAKSDAAFITSTTRDILPILEIDQQSMPMNPALIRSLQESFLRYRENYVASRAQPQVAYPV